MPPLPPPLPERDLISRERVFVREIQVVGSTVFSLEELAAVTAPYANRELTPEDLETLRVALTLLYVNKGYVNSGAILPDQTVVEGVITYQIIEGNVTAIEVTGSRWFRAGYLQRRIALATGPPLSVNALQQQIQLLLEDPRIRRLNAELKPGLKPGESVLNVVVEDRIPFRVSLGFDNYQSPAVGAEEGLATLEDVNLTGNGDVLSLTGGGSEGLHPILNFKYSLPFTAYDTTLSLQYRRNTSAVVQAAFSALGIDSNTQIYTVTLRQPVSRTLNGEFALELTGERLSNKSTLLGERFSLSPGARNGESIDTAIRFAQEWVYRTQEQVFAARSRFSLGIEALNATINPRPLPDGRFFTWLAQFQWVRRLPIQDTQLIFRTDLQLASNRLLTLEQFAVGGRYTVRGYQENTLVTDNAWVTSLEARVPLIHNTRWADYLELAPFVDQARAWDATVAFGRAQTLLSVGVGLRWAVTIPWTVPIRPQFEVYWGHRLKDVKIPGGASQEGGNLQDKGVSLQFVITTAF